MYKNKVQIKIWNCAYSLNTWQMNEWMNDSLKMQSDQLMDEFSTIFQTNK